MKLSYSPTQPALSAAQLRGNAAALRALADGKYVQYYSVHLGGWSDSPDVDSIFPHREKPEEDVIMEGGMPPRHGLTPAQLRGNADAMEALADGQQVQYWSAMERWIDVNGGVDCEFVYRAKPVAEISTDVNDY